MFLGSVNRNMKGKPFDSVKLSGKAIPLEDGNLDLTMESDDPDVDAEELANFFNEVVMP